MLLYLQVHFYYTLPPTLILYLLMRPLMSNFDKIKLVSISTLAVIYIATWYNYIIHHKALSYRKDAVLMTIGNVPIEEYLFFILQSVFATLWTNLCSRWTLHSLFLKTTSRFQFLLIRFSVIAVLTALMCIGWIYSVPRTKLFYVASMIWWSSVPLIGLWYSSGPYAYKRYKATLISVLVPSIYFYYLDMVAMRNRARYINEVTRFEEIAFFVLTNRLIALSSHALDKSKAIIDTYYIELFPPFGIGTDVRVTKRLSTYFKLLLDGSLCNEQNYDPSVISDVEMCDIYLHGRSKSISLAHKFFSNGEYDGLRHNLLQYFRFFNSFFCVFLRC